jgi:hypothetical protein
MSHAYQPRANYFDSSAEAEEWMIAIIVDVGGEPIDNHRFAYFDDDPAMVRYWEQQDNGCCASFDERVFIKGREAIIGCNYGH